MDLVWVASPGAVSYVVKRSLTTGGPYTVIATNVTVALVTGLTASLGASTLAGYGVAARIEYVLIPLIFGFGTALVTMVATNVGAGQRERAERIAWIGTGVVMAFTGAIGFIAAICMQVSSAKVRAAACHSPSGEGPTAESHAPGVAPSMARITPFLPPG